MSILSNRTNNKALILSGLLHEVEEKLGSYKLRRCMEIVDHSVLHSLEVPKIHAILETFSKSKEQSREAFAINVLSQSSSDIELLFLADTLSEIELTNSNIILKNTKELMNTLVIKRLIDQEDEFIIKINNAIENKLIHHNNGNKTKQSRKT
jgi:hypothetical protein